MTEAARTEPRRARDWRRPAVVAVSLAIHAVVLAMLAVPQIRPASPQREVFPQAIFIDIEPRPLLRGETSRPRPVQATAGAASAVRFRDPRRKDEDDNPLTPTPRLARPVPGAPGVVDPWQVRPQTDGEALARSLRSSPIGCDMRAGRMTAAEQALCDDRFGERAARAAPISGTGDAARDAGFARQGAQALADYDRRRRPLSGGTGVVGPADCVGSNFGTGCAGSVIDPSLAPDSTQNIRTDRRDGPR